MTHRLLKLGDRFLNPRNVFLRGVEDVGESAEKESNGTSNKGGGELVADESWEPRKSGSEGFEAARAGVFFIHLVTVSVATTVERLAGISQLRPPEVYTLNTYPATADWAENTPKQKLEA